MFVIFKKSFIFVICIVSVTQGRSGFGPNEQDWGYVTVRDNAHMFWWLHYTTATENYIQKPLVIWLQGGPGGSSTGIGNFQEIGPWDINQQMRNLSWIQYLNVLFVDNPVGTGFSYVENATETSQFASDNQVIADDFFALLKGFFNEKPEFQQLPIYIFGQSYGGKMTVDIALKVHEEIQAGNLNCSLKGIGLGDAWISPIDSLISWPSYLLNLGFIDTEGYDMLKIVTDTAKVAIDAGNFERATAYFHATQGFINRLTSVNHYNVLEPIEVEDKYWEYSKYTRTQDLEETNDTLFDLMNGPVMQSLNLSIPIKWGDQSEYVFKAVNIDFMKPVTESIERILNETDIEVTVYNGQLDLIVSTPGTINWVNNLRWSGADEWKKTNRTPIIIDGINEGFYKSYGKFGFFWINRAGHVVPSDNPHTMEYVLRQTANNYNNDIN